MVRQSGQLSAAIVMMDGSEQRNCQVAFEIQRSRVSEERDSLYQEKPKKAGGTFLGKNVWSISELQHAYSQKALFYKKKRFGKTYFQHI